MTDQVRRLNADGLKRFREHIEARRNGDQVPEISDILTMPSTSSGIDVDIPIEKCGFEDRYEFGEYLVGLLAPLDRRLISRDHGLWSWLALYFFEQLCPPSTPPKDVLSPEAYILPSQYFFRDYYRHLVRTPWMTVADHGEFAKVLLIPASAGKGNALSVRGEIMEQMASRQAILRNRRVIEAVYQMYWDANTGKPKKGTAGKRDAAGPPRRLALVLRQFDLTYDLDAAPPPQLVALLPKEFDRWKEA